MIILRKSEIHKFFLAALCVLALGACTKDKSEITSGGGAGTGVMSDGGASSAAFAGTYTGTLMLTISGGDISDETRTEPIVLVIRTDGTAVLTVDGETIDGVINGDTFGFSIRIVEVEDFIECEGTALITGRIVGSVADGAVSGSGECDFLTFDEDVDFSGSLTASKI